MNFRALLFLTLLCAWVPAQAADDRLAAAIAQFDAMHNSEGFGSFLKPNVKNHHNTQNSKYPGGGPYRFASHSTGGRRGAAGLPEA